MSSATTRLRIQVPADHPMFPGHFPEIAIVPGAWLLAQALRAVSSRLPVGCDWKRIDSVKFLATVQPGATLDIEIEGDARGAPILTIRRDASPVASVRFAMARADPHPA